MEPEGCGDCQPFGGWGSSSVWNERARCTTGAGKKQVLPLRQAQGQDDNSEIRIRLARRQRFDLPLNFRNCNGSKVGRLQLLVELCQSRLLESSPLGDAGSYLGARLVVNGDRLRRHGPVSAFDNAQSRCQTRIGILQTGVLHRVFFILENLRDAGLNFGEGRLEFRRLR